MKNLKEIKEGDVLIADSGFTCVEAGPVIVAYDTGGFYFRCQNGHHYLEGQADGDGNLVGLE